MPDTLGMIAQAGFQALRVAGYTALGEVMRTRAKGLPDAPRPAPTRPTPSRAELMADLRALVRRDAAAVRDRLYPPMPADGSPFDIAMRLAEMWRDVPDAARRRADREVEGARGLPAAQGLPGYYTQDFHFQKGGYLTAQSARLYDLQVELLFSGAAGPMRREALRPVAEFVRGRDQRRLALLDVACGTGRLLRDIRHAWPAMALTGLDLSAAYLDEARRHLAGLRPVSLVEGNAETMPFADRSFDIVTTVFLFHELPADVRRTVAAEMARVLKPGGLLVFVDSLQMGDRPGWDGLLESFPVSFHEPYYRHYTIDDLDGLFTAAGLGPAGGWTSFLAKVLVRRKDGEPSGLVTAS